MDKEAVRLVVKAKADEAAEKKGSVQPPVVSNVVFQKAYGRHWKLTGVFSLNLLCCL